DTTSGQEGLELVRQLAAHWPGVPVIAMTAWASVELAVEAMRLGAADFIEKPWQNARLLGVLESRIALDRSRRSEQRLGAANALLLEEAGEGFVAESPAMRRLVDDLGRIASSDAPALLLGENGTGKSMLAQLVHRWAERRERPLGAQARAAAAARLLEVAGEVCVAEAPAARPGGADLGRLAARAGPELLPGAGVSGISVLALLGPRGSPRPVRQFVGIDARAQAR